mgnify:FL=1
MLKICIIESYQSPFIENCLESLRLNTQILFDLKLFQEGESRESTLNNILSEMTGIDILVVADDILFTKGWDQALLAHWKENRILGFSMTYPGGEIIQDRGYRLVSIDGIVRSEAIDRGLKVASVTPFEYESRTSMTGCFQAIPASVSKTLNQFPLEGSNRLGELLYHSLAIKKGIEVGVVGHFLEHYAKSTKQNPNKKLSSESYLYEKDLWTQVTQDFRLDELTSVEITREIEQDLYDWFNLPGLIYGAGTITEFLAYKNDIKTHHLCSGLPEEDGMNFLGKSISHKDNIDWTNIKRVLITVEGKEELISRDLKNFSSNINIHAVKIRRTENVHYYDIFEIK